MIALAYSLGWDTLTGLGMSILATNMGFSAAVTNPFTIGVAQRLAGLPLFSGAWLRVIIFLVVYGVTALFLLNHARGVERDPASSPTFNEDRVARAKYTNVSFDSEAVDGSRMGAVIAWLLVFLVLILAVLVAAPFVSIISDLSLPLVGLLFFIGGVGAGFLSGTPRGEVFKSVGEGFTGILPAVPLILMAASVKFIVFKGGIMDTILHSASQPLAHLNPFMAALVVYGLALVIEVFISSGSAKAILMMPILLPLGDLIGITRQVTVTAYCFGDGFSNLAYPTNPVLLICLGLTMVSYPKWLKWTSRLWFWVLLVTVAFLGIAVAIHYGPF
jgi:uncharacterized ion transporter superfamily protein YfcC